MTALEHEIIFAATLKALSVCTNLAARMVCIGQDSATFANEAKEVVHLCGLVVRRRLFKTFVFACGVVPSLFVTLMIDRDTRVREDALQILREAEERAGLFWVAAEIVELWKQALKAQTSSETLAV